MTTAKTNIKFSGLQTFPNELSETQPGALVQADNCVLDRPSIVASRRGQTQYSTLGLSDGSLNVPQRLYPFNDELVSFNTAVGDNAASAGRFAQVAAQTSTPWVGTFQAPSGATSPRAAQANKNFYITTTKGILKNHSPSFTHPYPAGAPAGLDGKVTIVPTSSGWLQGGYGVAYRMILGYTDSNQNLVLGAPSPRIDALNPNATGYNTVNVSSVTNQKTITFSSAMGALDIVFATYTGGRMWFCQGTRVVALATLTSTGGIGPYNYSATLVDTSDEFLTVAAGGGAAYLAFSMQVTSVTAGTSTTNTALVMGSGNEWQASGSATTLYYPFNATNPADYSGAAAIAAPQAGGLTPTRTLTTAANGFSTGTTGGVVNITILASSSKVVQLTSVTGLPTAASFTIQLPGVTGLSNVASGGVNVGANTITVATFPNNIATGTAQWTQYATTTARWTLPVQAITTGPGTTFDLPWFAQLYRSEFQQPITSGVTTIPTDAMQLCAQVTLTALDLTHGYVDFTDVTPDSLLGAELYTSPGQLTINGANYQPPVSQDLALFQGSTFYANCTLAPSLSTELLAAGTGTAGLLVGSTVTVGTTTFTGAVTQPTTFPTTTFGIVDNVGDPIGNLTGTLVNLVQSINRSHVVTSDGIGVTAQITSTENSSPGNVVFQTSQGSASLALACSVSTAFSPNLSTQTPQTQPNALYFSHPGQPEAVPLLNYLTVGAANHPIQRIISLVDALYVLKSDGIYQVTGTGASTFNVSLFNTTVSVLAPDCVVGLQNNAIAYTTQGVIAFGASGVQILSRAIENDLRMLSADFANFTQISSATAYESDRKYILFCPSLAGDTYPTQAYVYNILTNAWTRWVGPRTCGAVCSGDDKLYFGSPVRVAAGPEQARDEETPGYYVYQERKSFTSDDYFDERFTGQAFLHLLRVFQFPNGVVPVPGQSIQGGSYVGQITTVTAIGTDFFGLGLTPNPPSDLSDVALLTPIQVSLTTVPLFLDDPSLVKQFQECVLTFASFDFDTLTATFTTDFNTYAPSVPYTVTARVGWGQFNWGQAPWGGFPTSGYQSVRNLIPRLASRGHWLNCQLTLAQCLNSFDLAGITVAWSPTSSLRFK